MASDLFQFAAHEIAKNAENSESSVCAQNFRQTSDKFCAKIFCFGFFALIKK